MIPSNGFDAINQFAQMTQQFREMQRAERMGKLVDAFQDQMIEAMQSKLPQQSATDARDSELTALRAEVEALKQQLGTKTTK